MNSAATTARWDEKRQLSQDELKTFLEFSPRMPQFGTTARKHKAILPWNATRCEEKKIKHLETGQAVQAISQIYNWWRHSAVFIVRERTRHRRGSTDAVAAAAREGIYFLLAKWIVNFLCISQTTMISMCSNRDREEYSAAHCWLRGEEAGGKILQMKDDGCRGVCCSIARDGREAASSTFRRWTGSIFIKQVESISHCGGLYFVQDEVFDLFITFMDKEFKALNFLSINLTSSVHLHKWRENLLWVCEDEDVKSVLSFINPNTIEKDTVRQDLLTDIAFLWVTNRGHSRAHQIKEDYKQQQKRGTERTRGLRKDLHS